MKGATDVVARLITIAIPVRDYETNEVVETHEWRGFRLIPGCPVLLTARWPEDRAADSRFISVFRDTWRRLPSPARRRILHYWRTDPLREYTRGPVSPLFELMTDLSEFEKDSANVIGMCSRRGHEVRFRTPIIDRMPDDHLATVVAHELAHVFHYASGDPTHTPPEGESELEGMLRQMRGEVLVKQMTEAWGFSEKGLDRWLMRDRRSQAAARSRNGGE
jgi:hypothetical protein